MRHIFKAIKPQREIRVGDLIRSDATGDFINIVLEIMPNGADPNSKLIRSVRYGKTNRGHFKLLNGQRSRLFQVPSVNRTFWEIVDEYAEVDNQALRANILESMKSVDTTYRAPKCEDKVNE
jgi:hypothetical protein